MLELTHLGKANIGGQACEIVLVDGEDLVYLFDENKEDFLASLKEDKDCLDIVEFKDPVFDQAIRKTLDKPFGALCQRDLDKIKSLDIADMDIEDFSGLEKLRNLERLMVWAVPSFARYLDLIKELKKLKYLDIGSCKIREIPENTFKGLDKLRELALDDNPFYHLGLDTFSTNKDLRCLHLDKTGINDLDFLIHTNNLEKLYADHNYISNISGLKHSRNIRVLSLSDNGIKIIDPIGYLKDLEILHLDYNKLSDIRALAKLKSLKTLRAEKNYIREISALEDLDDIEVLVLDDNQIRDLGPLKGKERLSQLSLRNNNIHLVSPIASLPGLKVLKLDGNDIGDYTKLGPVYFRLNKKDF